MPFVSYRELIPKSGVSFELHMGFMVNISQNVVWGDSYRGPFGVRSNRHFEEGASQEESWDRVEMPKVETYQSLFDDCQIDMFDG